MHLTFDLRDNCLFSYNVGVMSDEVDVDDRGQDGCSNGDVDCDDGDYDDDGDHDDDGDGGGHQHVW